MTADTIRAVETELNIRFPDDYVEFACLYHGANANLRFDYLDATGRCDQGCVHEFFSFSAQWSLSNLVYKNARFEMPDGWTAFAIDAGGALLCFDYNHSTENPVIVYWFEDMHFQVAQNFTELLDKLYQD